MQHPLRIGIARTGHKVHAYPSSSLSIDIGIQNKSQTKLFGSARSRTKSEGHATSTLGSIREMPLVKRSTLGVVEDNPQLSFRWGRFVDDLGTTAWCCPPIVGLTKEEPLWWPGLPGWPQLNFTVDVAIRHIED